MLQAGSTDTHQGSSVFPAGLVKVLDLREFNPALEMVRAFIKMRDNKDQALKKHPETALEFWKLTFPSCKVTKDLNESSKSPLENSKNLWTCFGAT